MADWLLAGSLVGRNFAETERLTIANVGPKCQSGEGDRGGESRFVQKPHFPGHADLNDLLEIAWARLQKFLSTDWHARGNIPLPSPRPTDQRLPHQRLPTVSGPLSFPANTQSSQAPNRIILPDSLSSRLNWRALARRLNIPFQRVL
jgi:hypothetical protein